VADELRTFEVSLVTPEGSAFDGEAEMLIVPGADGEIGVLARHAPLVAMLKAGSTRVHVRRGQDVREFVTGPGFF
jgi:F-type H+-transporting ATPase subunit epsilon